MLGKKAQPSSDLTSATAVQESQKVYDRITSGKTKDVTAELNATHGRDSKRG